jgi:glyoxylase-like metal-dependent hydrolase (beta-lactamase superfamily II)
MENGDKMNLTNNIKIYQVGYCKHFEFMVIRGGRFKTVNFSAMAALIPHPKGNLLFDSGYGEYFFDATKKFPQKLYALTTPVTLEKPLIKQLDQDVKYIFISHFHADHIGGLRDFPNVKFICSKQALELAKSEKLSNFAKTKQGVLPALLPDDFETRVEFIEDLPSVDLPKELAPFDNGYQLFDNIYIIELKGHAKGQYGMVVNDYFFVSDAVWDIRTITQNRMPNFLTRFIMDDYSQYIETIKKLQQLYQNNKSIQIIPTHCTSTLKMFV